ncbi:MAG: acyl-phosphate glycerol 3-phosphate acyltransferase [Alkaliphilus sp.]|nr:MAG: acyl-phosphate glycerol 3-phosphate acyltransferase [Alkaliphilus sp.]
MKELILAIILFFFSYLIGSIQPAYIIGKARGIDIRKHGSGNAGASNVIMTIGKKQGILVAAIDIFKAFLLVFVYSLLQDNQFLLDSYSLNMSMIVLGVVLGHDYPFYMQYRGGKGTSCYIGILLGLNPFLGIIALFIIFLFTLITDYIALGTLALVIIAPIIAIVYFEICIYVFISLVILSLLSTYKHRQNFMNILKGKETKVRKTLFG